MAANRTAKLLTVSASQPVTKNMFRLTLKGEDVYHFPSDAHGAYFKFNFEHTNTGKPVKRTFTVANFRREQHEIDVDFMLHGSSESAVDGVAAPWAMQAKVGDKVSISGPRRANFINLQADWFLLAADMTALPALTANLARLPNSATGYVVIEILSQNDQQKLDLPANMEVHWVINPDAGADASPLFDAIKQLTWINGRVSIWTACEFNTMKKIRQYYREQRSVPASHLYISSYWKKGLKEEEHKKAKRRDLTPMSVLRKIKSRLFYRQG